MVTNDQLILKSNSEFALNVLRNLPYTSSYKDGKQFSSVTISEITKRIGELERNIKTVKMSNKKYRFYKEDNRWYIDLEDYIKEGGDKEDLELVAGANDMLDQLSKGKNEITLLISLIENSFTYCLIKQDADGNYIFHDSIKDTFSKVWLCSVTKWLFGDYPEMIYLKIKK